MSTPNNGGQAFPGFEYTEGHGNLRRTHDGADWEVWQSGMTLRDYFAAAALTGSLSSDTEEWNCAPVARAQSCYKLADAMLAQRAKPISSDPAPTATHP